MDEIPESESGLCDVCRQPSVRKCFTCKLSFECSCEQQTENWQEHQSVCGKPYKVCQSPELGKYLRATRDLCPGDVIISELPLVFGPKPRLREEGSIPCVGCCRLIDEKNCFQCRECLWPACSKQCDGLKNHLSHGLECRILKLRPPTSADYFYKFFRFDVLIVLRALFLQKTNTTKWEQLLSLEAHLDKRGPSTETFKIIDEKVAYLQENLLIPLKNFEEESGTIILEETSNSLLHKIYGIIDKNACELTDDIDAVILYPTTSLLEHNCTPNAVQIIDGATENYKITVKAALAIKHQDHITSAYTNILWGTHARRNYLKKTKYLSCTCNRCEDTTEFGTFFSALKCLEPCGGTQLPRNPTDMEIEWICDRCDIKLPNAEVMKFVDHLGVEVKKVQRRKSSIREMQALLRKLLKFLHPNHYHIYSVKYSLVQLHGNKTEGSELSNFLLEKIEMCKSLIQITKTLDPGNARLGLYLGVLLNELFETKFMLLTRNFDEGSKNGFVEEIQEVSKLLKENRKVLENESKFNTATKLLVLVEKNNTRLQEWAKENSVYDLI